MTDQTYVITATHPDGTPYQTAADRNLHSAQPSATVVTGDKARAAKEQEIRAAGLTPHVRKA